MLLGVDIGNTTISFGIINDNRVVKTCFLELVPAKNEMKRKVAVLFSEILRQYPPLEKIIICSVVPSMSTLMRAVIKANTSIPLYEVGRDFIVPIKNLYRQPGQVGQDRLVCSYAAKCLYGYPVVVIDFGTAITFDIVTHQGDYAGGIIVPGIRLSAESLFEKTALLPKIDNIKAPNHLIGRDTQESILSGIFFGYGAMCSGLIEAIFREIHGRPKIVLTGGYADKMKKFAGRRVSIIDRSLIFRGLNFLHKSI